MKKQSIPARTSRPAKGSDANARFLALAFRRSLPHRVSVTRARRPFQTTRRANARVFAVGPVFVVTTWFGRPVVSELHWRRAREFGEVKSAASSSKNNQGHLTRACSVPQRVFGVNVDAGTWSARHETLGDAREAAWFRLQCHKATETFRGTSPRATHTKTHHTRAGPRHTRANANASATVIEPRRPQPHHLQRPVVHHPYPRAGREEGRGDTHGGDALGEREPALGGHGWVGSRGAGLQVRVAFPKSRLPVCR